MGSKCSWMEVASATQVPPGSASSEVAASRRSTGAAQQGEPEPQETDGLLQSEDPETTIALDAHPRPPNYEPLHVRGLTLMMKRWSEDAFKKQQEIVDGLSNESKSAASSLGTSTTTGGVLQLHQAKYKLALLERRMERFAELDTYCCELPRQIFEAATDGDVDYVRLALDIRVDVDSTDEQGMTPLIHATITNKPSVITFLISHGASVNVQDDNGATCVHYAVMLGHARVLRELIEAPGGRWAMTLTDHRDQTAIDYARPPSRNECLRVISYSLGGPHAIAWKSLAGRGFDYFHALLLKARDSVYDALTQRAPDSPGVAVSVEE